MGLVNVWGKGRFSLWGVRALGQSMLGSPTRIKGLGRGGALAHTEPELILGARAEERAELDKC